VRDVRDIPLLRLLVPNLLALGRIFTPASAERSIPPPVRLLSSRRVRRMQSSLFTSIKCHNTAFSLDRVSLRLGLCAMQIMTLYPLHSKTGFLK